MEKFKDFLKRYPDITVVGMAWSIYWRMALILFFVGFVLNLIFLSLIT